MYHQEFHFVVRKTRLLVDFLYSRWCCRFSDQKL